jgi:hypothetical protein
LNLGLRGVKFGVAAGDLFVTKLKGSKRFGAAFLSGIQQCLHGAGDPIREGGIGVEAGQFSVQIHANIIPPHRA